MILLGKSGFYFPPGDTDPIPDDLEQWILNNAADKQTAQALITNARTRYAKNQYKYIAGTTMMQGRLGKLIKATFKTLKTENPEKYNNGVELFSKYEAEEDNIISDYIYGMGLDKPKDGIKTPYPKEKIAISTQDDESLASATKRFGEANQKLTELDNYIKQGYSKFTDDEGNVYLEKEDTKEFFTLNDAGELTKITDPNDIKILAEDIETGTVTPVPKVTSKQEPEQEPEQEAESISDEEQKATDPLTIALANLSQRVKAIGEPGRLKINKLTEYKTPDAYDKAQERLAAEARGEDVSTEQNPVKRHSNVGLKWDRNAFKLSNLRQRPTKRTPTDEPNIDIPAAEQVRFTYDKGAIATSLFNLLNKADVKWDKFIEPTAVIKKPTGISEPIKADARQRIAQSTRYRPRTSSAELEMVRQLGLTDQRTQAENQLSSQDAQLYKQSEQFRDQMWNQYLANLNNLRNKNIQAKNQYELMKQQERVNRQASAAQPLATAYSQLKGLENQAKSAQLMAAPYQAQLLQQKALDQFYSDIKDANDPSDPKYKEAKKKYNKTLEKLKGLSNNKVSIGFAKKGMKLEDKKELLKIKASSNLTKELAKQMNEALQKHSELAVKAASQDLLRYTKKLIEITNTKIEPYQIEYKVIR